MPAAPSGQTGNLLSGVPLQKGPIVRSGITMDQVIANRVGQGTPLCSLYLSLMDRMGVTLDHFGDADTRLKGL